MKKLCSLLVIVCTLVAFTACPKPQPPAQEPTPVPQPTAAPTEAPAPQPTLPPSGVAACYEKFGVAGGGGIEIRYTCRDLFGAVVTCPAKPEDTLVPCIKVPQSNKSVDLKVEGKRA